MEENNLESKKSSKELWLVLIFVDLIAICVFGYLIYNSFINSNKKTIQINHNSETAEVVLEEIDLSEPVKKENKEEEKESKQAPKQEPVKEIKKEEISEIKDKTKEVAEPLPQKENKEIKTQTETKTNIKKESVKIAGTGKWRQVTFKYFDDGKNVAIVSGFTSTKPRDLKKVNGVWEITLTISPGTYRYMFIVDGKEIKDPYNNQESNGRSVIVI